PHQHRRKQYASSHHLVPWPPTSMPHLRSKPGAGIAPRGRLRSAPMSSPAFRIPSPDEQETFAAVVTRAFGVTDTLDWVRGLGIENNRVLFEAGELVGGLVRYQAGQWFGGNRLSMVGIAGVAVEPHRRGLGV